MITRIFLASFRLWAACRHLILTLLHAVTPASLRKPAAVVNKGQSSNVVLITGSSTGIGRHAALYLASKGFTVLAGVRNVADGKRLADEFMPESEKSGGAVVPIHLDVCDADSVRSAYEVVCALLAQSPHPETTRLVAVINNAGISPALCPVEMLDVEGTVKRVIDVNVYGALRVTQTFLPLLRDCSAARPGSARVVMIGSANGFIGVAGMSAYCASKYALEGVTDCLRQELRDADVHVTMVEPGPILTPIFNKYTLLPSPERPGLSAKHRKECVDLYGRYLLDHGAERVKDNLLRAAVGPELTSVHLEHAICSPFPATRYRVGPVSLLLWWGRCLLPDRVLDTIQDVSLRVMSAV